MAYSAYRVARYIGNFGGLNTYQAPENLAQGHERSAMVETPEELNFYSWPSGAMTKLFGSARLNTNALESGAAIHGLGYLGEIASKLFVVVNGKFYEHVSAGTQTDRTGSITITAGQNNLVDHALIANLAMFTDRQRDAPWKWSGTGAIAALGGSPPSGKYCVAFKRRAFIFNTSANPEDGYFSGLDDPESWDTTNDLLNFDTKDGAVITMAKILGESMIVGKEGPDANMGHLFRVYDSVGDPPFLFEEIPSGGIGPVSQQAAIVHNNRLYFLGKDNAYVLIGNEVIPIGGPIVLTLRDYIKSRFEFSWAGLLRERNLLAFTFTGQGSTNTRAQLYDYGVSIPNRRDIWHPASWAMNAMAERVSGGQHQLITGGFTGFYEQQNSGDAFGGAAFSAYRLTPWLHLGDPETVKKIRAIVLRLKNTGYNTTVEYRTDFGTAWSTTQALSGAGGALFGTGVFGTDVFGGSDTVQRVAEISREATWIQFRFSNSSANQPITIYAFAVLHRLMRRALVYA